MFLLTALLACGLSVFGRPPSTRRATGGSPLPDSTSILNGMTPTLDSTYTSPLLESYFPPPATHSTPSAFYPGSVVLGTSLLPAVKLEDSNNEETASAFPLDNLGGLTNLKTAPAPEYSPDPWFNSGSEVSNNQIGLDEPLPIISSLPSYIIPYSTGRITDDIRSSFRRIRSGDCPYGLYKLSRDLQQYLFHCGEEPTWANIEKLLKIEFEDQNVGGKVVVPIFQSNTIHIGLIQYTLYETNRERLEILSSNSDYDFWVDGLRHVFKHEDIDPTTIFGPNGPVEMKSLVTSQILTDFTLFDKFFGDDNTP